MTAPARYPLRCLMCPHPYAQHRYWTRIWCRVCRDFRRPVHHDLSTRL